MWGGLISLLLAFCVTRGAEIVLEVLFLGGEGCSPREEEMIVTQRRGVKKLGETIACGTIFAKFLIDYKSQA